MQWLLAASLKGPMRYPDDGHFSISLMHGGTEAVFAGGIAHGVADKIAAFLDQVPKLRAVGLWSNGGRIVEAAKVRDLIRARKLDTYVYEQCVSAGTIAFLGGRNRYVTGDGQLGFHMSSLPDRIEFDDDPCRHQNLVDSAKALGIDAAFAERAYNTPQDMWFPNVVELIQSKFVTGIAYGWFPNSELETHRHPADELENAISALESGDYEDAARLFRPLADQGDAFALFVLGFVFASGKGVQQDHKEAAKWYRLSAEKGNTSAQNNLGIAYSSGLGVPQDDAQAVKLIRQASEQGERWAQANLARRYYHGIGVPQNCREAVRWYQLAAEQGNPAAQGQLGFMYSKGQGVPENHVVGYMWLALAASARPHRARDPDWDVYRDRLAVKMTPAQIGEAERLVRTWRPRRVGDLESFHCEATTLEPRKRWPANCVIK